MWTKGKTRISYYRYTFLLFYINHLKEHFGFLGSVFPIIVDHGLRIESNNEALKTKKLAGK